MITKYNDFLLEKLITMINESEVVFSDKFRKIIKDIESPISKVLLDIENKDYKVTSNYFDVSDDKETLSFIPDRRAQALIKDRQIFVFYNGDGGILTHNIAENGTFFDELGYTPEGPKGYKPDVGEKGLMISKAISKKTGRTYLNVKFGGGSCVVRQDNISYEDFMKEIWTKNRQAVRTGRAVLALLNATGNKFKTAEIEDFVNKYKMSWDRMNSAFGRFELVEGDKIGYWYSSKRYEMSKGTLSNSCMSGVPVSYFEIYTSNPKVCKLLIMKNEDGDRIRGRALVWTLDKPEGIIYMDRVYSHEDSDVQLFREYAKHQGWYYKPRNDSSDTSDMVSPTGETVNKGNLYVKISPGGYDSYPYVDTLKYFNSGAGTLSTYCGNNTTCLDDTDGGGNNDDCDYCGGSGQVECSECEGGGSNECGECDGSGKSDCDSCDGNGEIDCGECDSGLIDCDTCGGSGEDEDGKSCSDCTEGKVRCSDCNGKGKIDCGDCDGSGSDECGECNGRGRNSCDYCGGSGMYDCPECN